MSLVRANTIVNADNNGPVNLPFGFTGTGQGYVSLADSSAVVNLSSTGVLYSINPTAARTLTLNGSGVTAGTPVTIINRGNFDVAINAQDASALTLANGINADATTRRGFVTLLALVDDPSNVAHWRVLDVQEDISYSTTSDGSVIANAEVHLQRKMNFVSGWGFIDATAGGGGTTQYIVGTLMPTRLRPTTTDEARGASSVQINGTLALCRTSVNSVGEIYFLGSAVYGGTCWGSNTQISWLIN